MLQIPDRAGVPEDAAMTLQLEIGEEFSSLPSHLLIGGMSDLSSTVLHFQGLLFPIDSANPVQGPTEHPSNPIHSMILAILGIRSCLEDH